MKAFIVIDYQFDFADPKGSLYVNGAETFKDDLIKTINQKKSEGYKIIFSKDWHTPDHVSFEEWPPHCVQNTDGAKLLIDESLADHIILKGDLPDSDSYSIFYRGFQVESELVDILKNDNIDELEICGLALDVCVFATYKDAKDKGYKVKVLTDFSKPINQNFVLEQDGN
jgi:nicotinamidase/pyrazinamidase